MLLLISIIPIVSATNNKIEIKDLGDQIESGFMIGIMHINHIKTGWGWTTIWKPICILRISEQGRQFLGPSSGSFTPYDIDGFIGPLYYIFSNPYISGPFFICAYVDVWILN